ncbi:T9SS type A sorting domain-containing protein [Aequorivita sp. H23M31]|uniref:T9SS type A sorting domain-containing protein n=1 Tax=Aequorivita ciconiae TaxID=2494375 RepID=A0A410FZF4_9FLAO|nr:GEVED domain-containing protein [Aequorivita sp. H23M31]QAA80394.1 T9SS type A sorting domain-containing protein [Aequorivita sp. H23M31]
MKRITILSIIVGLFSLTMNAQFIQSNAPDSRARTTDVQNPNQEGSIQELLSRYQSLGKQSGSISQFFTKDEQKALRSYFNSQKGTTPAMGIRDAGNGNSQRSAQLPAAYYNSGQSATMEVVEGRTVTSQFDAQSIIPFTGVSFAPRGSLVPELLYDNGPHFNIAGPPKVSRLEDLSLGMGTFGSACNSGGPFTIADDFVLSADAEITTMDFYAYQTNSAPPTVNAVYIKIWNGDPSNGGSVVWGDMTTNRHAGTVSSNVYRQLESAPGNTSREIQLVTANTPGLSLDAGTYWVEFMFGGTGSSGPWAPPIVILGSSTTGNAIQSNAGVWSPLVDVGPQGMPFQIYGTPAGGGATFPEPYCGPITYSSDVEPITLVEVAGISNRTSGDINGTPAHEDFTSIIGNMEEGESYTIALEGNTNGGFTCSFTVFIDWNQDGILDNDTERYEIGTINGSTGNDGQQATGTIVVPAGVAEGPTRMRVMKRFGSTYVPDSCTGGSGWGQSEDYTIDVTANGGDPGGTACSQNNPANGFENGFTTSKNQSQLMATDINVPADTDFTMNKITVEIWSNPGTTVTSADITFYDNAGGTPGATRGTQLAVAPTSSTVVGSNFGFDISEVVFNITPEMLPGEAGSTKVYWVSLYLDMPSGSGYLGGTSNIVGLQNAYSADAGVTWNTNGGWDSVYVFEGICETEGGTTPGPLTTVYGIDNATQDLIGFGTSDPQNAEIFGTSPITVNFENAGAIDPANPTTGYVLDNGGQFFSFDVTSGFYTALGSIAGDWVGMEFDQNTGILYAIKSESLYTIDPVALTATLVGSFGLPSNALSISLAIDGAGVGYIHDLGDDLLYSVNLATGAATAIGSTGFDANFGQGMCYDPTTDTVYMSAFNSTTFMAEWRSVNTTTGMTTLIAPMTTVNDTSPQVAWSSVGETLDPPTCPKPTFLTVTDITETSATLNWVAEPNASNGYIWYVFGQGANPMTDTPVATGTTPAGTTTATATGLENASSYDFYVVADCGASDGLSAYAGPVTFSTLITPPACGGKFYDTGGPDGNYGNNENVTTVIMPDNPGDFVTVTFLSFNVEANWDALYVYDGPDANSPMIASGNPATNSGFPAGGYYGTTIPGPFSSTHESGALTFVFRSESSFTYSGWEADVTCAMYPPPNDKIVNSIDVGAIGFPYTDPAVRMPAATPENGSPEDCDLTGAYGVWYHFTTTGDGSANANIVTPAGASNVTFYTAPGPGAIETDLVRVQQSSNACNPGTSANINFVANQTYYVFVMNSDAVTDIQIDANVLGVPDNALGGFTYYPNPTNGILNLSSKEMIEMVSIYNLLGQRVLDSSLNSTSSVLDISGLSVGTYVMKVVVNGQTGTYKLLKQ